MEARRQRQTRPIIVKKYTTNGQLERGLTEMSRRGYTVQAQATNKNGFSAGQTHVVTFRKDQR
jgi:hypothetical protein